MNKLVFYGRLAVQNLSKNRQFLLPYGLTAAGCAAMFYLMRYLSYCALIPTMRGAMYVELVLGMGTFVVGVTVLFLLWYANKFVTRQRQKEMGLYHILGMKKGQLAFVQVLESLMLAAASTAAGLAVGILFSKLMLLLLLRLLRLDAVMGFSVSLAGVRETVVLMAALFALLLGYNLRALGKARPVELLHGGQVGEKEPKSRRLLAAFGLFLLAGGYAISLLTTSPVMCVGMFFPAVLLVIFGTFALFRAGTVVALKALRANKGFYYQPRHFTTVSGLLYRMNQNANGLSNICILATMVLVALSSTVCLYIGTEDALASTYPHALSIQFSAEATEPERAQQLADTDFSATEQQVAGIAADQLGGAALHQQGYLSVSFAAERLADGVYSLERRDIANLDKVDSLCIVTAQDYTEMTGTPLTLAPGQVAVCGLGDGLTALRIADREYPVAQNLPALPMGGSGAFISSIGGNYAVVVPDKAMLMEIFRLQAQAYDTSASPLFYAITLDPEATAQQMPALYDRLTEQLFTEERLAAPEMTGLSHEAECRQIHAEEYYAMNGGFLFLGIFLGLMFLLATVLIIYYKQLSEGYEDRQRFIILQKVGMSQREVQATIRSQVLMVFFLPLAMAALHITMAYPMISRLLTLFALDNQTLFLLCTGATLMAFTLVYVLVYTATARKYYRIVRA